MKRIVCAKLKGGTMQWQQIVTPLGQYRVGEYTHPLGLVRVYCAPKQTTLISYQTGQIIIRTREDHPTDRQISNDCRALLYELNADKKCTT